MDASGIADGSDEQALQAAVIRGDLEVAKSLLSSLANPNAIDTHGETPLFEAASSGSINLVAVLLQWGADPSKPSRDGLVPRDLTVDTGILTLFDFFEKHEVPTSSKEAVLAKLEPGLSKEFEEIMADESESEGEQTQFKPPVEVFEETSTKLGAPRDVSEHDALAASKQIFEIVNTKRCKVYSKPDLDSAVLTSKSRGGFVHGVEVTMNFWLRLHGGGGGWMLMDMQGINGQREVLRPKEGLDFPIRSFQPQGVACLQVLVEAVYILSAPCEQGRLLSKRASGEVIFVESQSCDGWLRLTGGDGWVRGGLRGGLGSATLFALLEEGTEQVDLWALSDVWRAARREGDGALDSDTVLKLLDIQDECSRMVDEKLRSRTPGDLDSYLQCGLTEKDMTLSRCGIGRRLFRIILTEKLQAGEVLKKPADLVFSEHLPALLQAVGKLQFEEEGDLKELNLGSDDTILDPETGKVLGLWNSSSRHIMPMTHMCDFYQDQGRAASPEAIAEQGEDVEQMALVVGREDLLQIGGHEDSVKAAFDDCMDKVAVGDEATMAGALVRCKQFASDCRFKTGLEVSEGILAAFETSGKVDIDFTRDMLKCRAACWAALGEHEQVLIETDQILALENEFQGEQRHFFHTGMLEDAEVKKLRRNAFAARRGVRDREACTGTAWRLPSVKSTLADID